MSVTNYYTVLKLCGILNNYFNSSLKIKNPATEAAEATKKLGVKTNCDSLLKIQMINEKAELLDDRLNVLLGNILVN